MQRGATHLWANTVLSAGHPLQMSSKWTEYENRIEIIGQPPLCVDKFDNKSFLNDTLRRHGGFTLPRSWTIDAANSTDPKAVDEILDSAIRDTGFPLVAKPVRGRGSQGVKICYNPVQLKEHVTNLLAQSPCVMLEEYLSGDEGTVTVMPHAVSASQHTGHWSLPPVVRFNHADGVAPYSGDVAVTANSRALTPAETESDPTYSRSSSSAKLCVTCSARQGQSASIFDDLGREGISLYLM